MIDTTNTTVPSPDAQKIIGQISAMAMVDEEFKSRLATNPAPVFAEHGLHLPEGTRVELVRAAEEIPASRGPQELYLIIPSVDDLSEEDLSRVRFAAASCQSTASTACTTPSCVSSASTASTNSCS
jgi:hypothetical protein